MAENENKLGDIDAWFESLFQDEGTADEIEVQSPTTLFQVDYEGFFVGPNGLMVPVAQALREMRARFHEELLPLDPSFCSHYSSDAEQIVVEITNSVDENIIKYPTIQNVIFKPNKNPTFMFAIWRENQYTNWENNTSEMLLGRTLARNLKYDLTVDRYYDRGESINYQAMLRRFAKEDQNKVEAVLFLDAMSNTTPYQNAFLFSGNENQSEEFADVFRLQHIKRSLFAGLDGIDGLETPVM